MKTRKKGLLKKATAGMLASMMLVGNLGTVYAAESDEIRSKAKAAYEEADYEKAKLHYDKLIAMEEATAGDYWYSGASDSGLGFQYVANEKFDITRKLMEDGQSSKSVAEQKIRSMFRAGDYWYVEKYFNEAVKNGIVTTFMKSVYADSLANCKQYEKARSMYEEILAAYEGEEVSYRTTYLEAIGNMYKYMGQHREAEEKYSEILALDGQQEDYNQRMAEMELEYKLNSVDQVVSSYLGGMSKEKVADVLAEQEYYKEAISYYEKAESEDGAEVRSSMASTYYDWGMPKKAAEIYEELLDENPEDTSVMNALGAVYCDGLGRYEDAEALFNKILEMNPDANGTSSNLGVVARKRGDLSQIAAAYQNTIELFPEYISPYNYRIMYQEDITVEEAMEIFSACPGWPETDEMQALMLMDTISNSATDITLESYLAYYQERLAEDETNYYFLKAVADLLKTQGRYEEALDYYLKASDVAGILSYYAVNGVGDCYFYCGQYEEAIACYEQNAAEFYAPNLIRSTADCYLMMADFENAKAALEKYREAGGTDSIASYAMMIAYQENDYEALLNYAEECLEEDPGNVKAKAYKAAALKALEMEGAEEIIADIDSITYSAGNGSALIVESILGRLDRAREIYQEMQTLYPADARQAVKDFEIRNLLQDPEFCEMAGLEAPKSNILNVFSGNAEGEESAKTGLNPIAVGAGALVGVAGAVAILLKKKSR